MEEIKISLNSKDNEALIQRAGELSNETDDVSERLQTYMGNFLHLLVMALTLITSKEQKTVHYTANWKRFWKEKRHGSDRNNLRCGLHSGCPLYFP